MHYDNVDTHIWQERWHKCITITCITNTWTQVHYDKVDIRALQLRSFICITNTWTHVHCVNICAFKYVRVNYVGICALRFCRCACITITWIYIRAFKLRGLVHYICVRAWRFYVVCMHFRCVCLRTLRLHYDMCFRSCQSCVHTSD